MVCLQMVPNGPINGLRAAAQHHRWQEDAQIPHNGDINGQRSEGPMYAFSL